MDPQVLVALSHIHFLPLDGGRSQGLLIMKEFQWQLLCLAGVELQNALTVPQNKVLYWPSDSSPLLIYPTVHELSVDANS